MIHSTNGGTILQKTCYNGGNLWHCLEPIFDNRDEGEIKVASKVIKVSTSTRKPGD